MCCLFSNCCNCNKVYIRGPRGFTGPMGPRGPIGPQGPVGPQGLPGQPATFNSVYALGTGGAIATNAIIPIALNSSTPLSTITVSNNAVNLPSAGTYLISYAVNGSVNAGTLDTSLYLNGTAIPNETLVQSGTVNGARQGSKTILINTTAPATLSLYNTSAGTATITNASITATKIA